MLMIFFPFSTLQLTAVGPRTPNNRLSLNWHFSFLHKDVWLFVNACNGVSALCKNQYRDITNRLARCVERRRVSEYSGCSAQLVRYGPTTAEVCFPARAVGDVRTQTEMGHFTVLGCDDHYCLRIVVDPLFRVLGHFACCMCHFVFFSSRSLWQVCCVSYPLTISVTGTSVVGCVALPFNQFCQYAVYYHLCRNRCVTSVCGT